MKKIALTTCAIIALTACSEGTKQDLGLANTAPDEFAVVTRAPLSVPPDYTLRPPRPGAGRPMEMSTQDQARQTVFGVEDVQPSSAKTAERPSGDFLNRIGADQADPDIRAKVDAEGARDNRTTAQKLLMMDREAANGEPIDPNAEYERLKSEGVVATKKRNEEMPAP